MVPGTISACTNHRLCVYETVSLYERIAAHTTDVSVYLFKRGEPYVAFSWVEKSKSGFNLPPSFTLLTSYQSCTSTYYL